MSSTFDVLDAENFCVLCGSQLYDHPNRCFKVQRAVQGTTVVRLWYTFITFAAEFRTAEALKFQRDVAVGEYRTDRGANFLDNGAVNPLGVVVYKDNASLSTNFAIVQRKIGREAC